MNSIPAVYFVSNSEEVGPLAIRPKWNRQKNTVLWEDTGRGMVVHLGESSFSFADYQPEKNSIPSSIEISSSTGEKYHLEKLTKEIYDEKVKHQVVDSKEFETTEQIQDFYLKQDFFYP